MIALQIRAIDDMTEIPMLAIIPQGEHIMRRAGYRGLSEHIILVDLNNLETNHDPFKWRDRTRHSVHAELQDWVSTWLIHAVQPNLATQPDSIEILHDDDPHVCPDQQRIYVVDARLTKRFAQLGS